MFPVNLPPQQVTTQQGGYAGTISQWGGCVTPFGYIFPDSLQGKIFVLGEGLEEVSMNGMIRYTNDNLSVLTDKYTGYQDNPFKAGDRGILSAFDFVNKRWLMVKNHPENPYTLSFDLITKSFVSFHSYQPNILLSRDNRLFGAMNNNIDLKFYEHNKGNYGSFYGEIPEDSIITIIVNTGTGSQGGKGYQITNTTEKVFDNIMMSMDSDNGNTLKLYRNVGDTIEVFNERQYSGVTKLIWGNTYGYIPARDEVRVQALRDYKIDMPLNSLISDAVAIYDNNGNPIGAVDQNKLFRDRMKGNYVTIKLTFKNTDNYKLTLNEITAIFREYKR